MEFSPIVCSVDQCIFSMSHLWFGDFLWGRHLSSCRESGPIHKQSSLQKKYGDKGSILPGCRGSPGEYNERQNSIKVVVVNILPPPIWKFIRKENIIEADCVWPHGSSIVNSASKGVVEESSGSSESRTAALGGGGGAWSSGPESSDESSRSWPPPDIREEELFDVS